MTAYDVRFRLDEVIEGAHSRSELSTCLEFDNYAMRIKTAYGYNLDTLFSFNVGCGN